MDFLTHLVFGALLYTIFMRDVTFDYLFLAIFFSVLPDLDIFLFPLRRKFKSNYLEHRGGSHSFVIGIIASLIGGGIFSILTHHPFFISWMVAIIFYSLHVSMDLLTTTKIPFLYPLSKRERSFYVEKAGSMFTMINSMIYLIVYFLLFFYSSTPLIVRAFNTFYATFFIVYYLYRITTKIGISTRLNPNQKYFPGVLPFMYYIFEQTISDNGISSVIIKKSHFSKSKKIINYTTSLTPKEKKLFEIGKAIVNKDYYFSKWTLFPLFLRNDRVLSIQFFFLETMINKRTLYNQFDFSLKTQEIINFHQGYGSLTS